MPRRVPARGRGIAIAALTATVAITVAPTVAAATTPAKAYASVRTCLTRAGAVRFVRHAAGSGTAIFADYTSITWTFVVKTGRVSGVAKVSTLTGARDRNASACLAPYRQ
jgi:hypothetical protein